MTELWTEIHTREDYWISSLGRIWSVKSKIYMKPYLHKSRSNLYLRVNLKGKKFMVHILVAVHHIPNPDNLKQVDHLDGNTLNPNKNNLGWKTESKNKIKAWAARRPPELTGEMRV